MDPIAARRLEEKERRRAEILDAAQAVAAAEGFDGLTMDMVARKARLSRALLYTYFQDRADLHLGLCQRALAMLHDGFSAAIAREASGIDQLLAMGRAYVRFAGESPVYFEALARFQASPGDDVAGEGNLPACLAAGARVHELMLRSLETGMQDGSVSRTAGEPNAVAIALWALMHGTIQLVQLKSAVLARHGVTERALIEQSLRVATVSLARG